MTERSDRPASVPHECPLTDAVIAQFLDGACDADTPDARDELAAHREECCDCREALERARRLDALVAATTARGGERGPGGQAQVLHAKFDAWLETAIAARPSPLPARAPRSGLPLLVGAAALVLLGVVVGVALSRRDRVIETSQERRAGQEHSAGREDIEPIAMDSPGPMPAPGRFEHPVASEWLRGMPAPIVIADGARTRLRSAVRVTPQDFADALRGPLLPFAAELASRLDWQASGGHATGRRASGDQRLDG